MQKICSINIHKMYNFLLINYNEISLKENLFILKQTLRMLNKNVIVNDFNLYYFH